ncbi:MAG: O-antigen ligase family protein, partial [archaeon]|nr:O-antigen ligase family protein [archaeon]
MQANKVLRYSILTGIFLLPFVCLIVFNNLFFPFITGKNFAFRIIVEIITGLWIILALRDKSVLPKSSRLLQVFAIFIGVIFISDLLSPNVYKSFWSNYERMEGWVTLAHLFALFVVLSSVMTKKLWEWLFRVSVGVSLIVFVYGSFQLSGKFAIHQGGVRLDATFGNATYLAVYMLFHIFLNLLLFVSSKRGSLWRWFYGVAILAEVFILYHTATRGATLGLIGGLFLTALLVLIFHRENENAKKGAIGLVIGLVVLVGLFFVFKNNDFVKNSPILGRFSDLSVTDKTAQSRFMIWNMAFQGFKERPIFGWGQESFNYVFNKYYDPKMYSQEQWFDRTHNVFFDWLI